jgi:hypothetical protein
MLLPVPALPVVIIRVPRRATLTGTGGIREIPLGTLVALSVIIIRIPRRATVTGTCGIFVIPLGTLVALPVVIIGVPFRAAVTGTRVIFVISRGALVALAVVIIRISTKTTVTITGSKNRVTGRTCRSSVEGISSHAVNECRYNNNNDKNEKYRADSHQDVLAC